MASKLLAARRYPALAVLLAGMVGCAYLWGNMLGEPPVDRVSGGWPMRYLEESRLLPHFPKLAGNLVLFPVAFIALLEAFRGAARLLPRCFGPEAPAAVHRLAVDRYSFATVLLASLTGSYVVFQNMHALVIAPDYDTTGWPFTYIRIHDGPVQYSRATLWANVILFPLILIVVCQAVEMFVRPVRGQRAPDGAAQGIVLTRHRRSRRIGELFAATVTGGVVGAAIYVSVLIAFLVVDLRSLRWPGSVIYLAAGVGTALCALQMLSRGARRHPDQIAEKNIP